MIPIPPCKQGTRKLTPLKFSWPTRRATTILLGMFFVRIMEDHVHPILVGGCFTNPFEKYAPNCQIGSWISPGKSGWKFQKSLRNATTHKSGHFPPTHPDTSDSSKDHLKLHFPFWTDLWWLDDQSFDEESFDSSLLFNVEFTAAFLRRSNHFRRNEQGLQISGFFVNKSIFWANFSAKKMSQTDMFFRVFFVVKIDIDLSPKNDNFIQLKGKIKFCSVFANCRAGNESKDTKKQKHRIVHLMASIEVQYESSLLFLYFSGVFPKMMVPPNHPFE